MDLRQFECFLAVAAELHFGRAAEKLYMSQSTVSEAIKRLEHNLGGQLFDRTSRRVSLTPLGERLRAEAAPAVSQLKNAIEDCKQVAAGRKRILKVGFLGGGFYELYQPLMTEFHAAYPSVVLELVELSYVTHFSAIADGTVDVGFCRLPLGDDGLQHGPISMLDQRMLCVAQDHPFTKEELLDPERLASERVIRMVPGSVSREWQDHHFPRYTPAGKPIADGPTARTIREAIAAVSAKQGVFMLTRRAVSYYATPRISFVAIDLPAMPSALVWRAGDDRQVIKDMNALLLHIGRRYGTVPHVNQVA